MPLPKLTRVRQTFDTTRLEDAAAAVATGLKNLPLVSKIKPGARIAITAGSRGIHNLVKMTRAAVDTVKALGGQPFVVPAMGSHGGATDEGQKSLLAELGIDHSRARAKSMDEFAGQRFDFVITLCDGANETCPLFFGGVKREHLGFEDPARATGTEDEILAAFRRVRDLIRRDVEAYLISADRG